MYFCLHGSIGIFGGSIAAVSVFVMSVIIVESSVAVAMVVSVREGGVSVVTVLEVLPFGV